MGILVAYSQFFAKLFQPFYAASAQAVWGHLLHNVPLYEQSVLNISEVSLLQQMCARRSYAPNCAADRHGRPGLGRQCGRLRAAGGLVSGDARVSRVRANADRAGGGTAAAISTLCIR